MDSRRQYRDIWTTCRQEDATWTDILNHQSCSLHFNWTRVHFLRQSSGPGFISSDSPLALGSWRIWTPGPAEPEQLLVRDEGLKVWIQVRAGSHTLQRRWLACLHTAAVFLGTVDQSPGAHLGCLREQQAWPTALTEPQVFWGLEIRTELDTRVWLC